MSMLPPLTPGPRGDKGQTETGRTIPRALHSPELPSGFYLSCGTNISPPDSYFICLCLLTPTSPAPLIHLCRSQTFIIHCSPLTQEQTQLCLSHRGSEQTLQAVSIVSSVILRPLWSSGARASPRCRRPPSHNDAASRTCLQLVSRSSALKRGSAAGRDAAADVCALGRIRSVSCSRCNLQRRDIDIDHSQTTDQSYIALF